MEKALRYEINQNIPELNNKVFPTNAPEGQLSPLLVYIKDGFTQTKTLEGYKKRYETAYLLNILCAKHSDMDTLTSKVKDLIIGFIGNEIGQHRLFVQNVKINNITSSYENELKMNRGIIDVEFVYEEE